MTEHAKLTQPYLVFLAVHNVDVTVPAGTEFEMIAKLRDEFYGLYQHPQYGEICVQTKDAIEC
jgi:hypothetical protein